MNRAPGTSGGAGNGGGGSGGGGSSSLMAGLRGFNNDIVQQTSVAGSGAPGGGLANHLNSAQNSATAPGGSRVKQPPPGFDPLSMLNSGSSNGQHSSQRNLLSPGKIFFSFFILKTVI